MYENKVDNISNIILWECASTLVKPHCKLFNQSINQRVYPSHQTIGYWHPIYKANECWILQTNCSLFCISKIYESELHQVSMNIWCHLSCLLSKLRIQRMWQDAVLVSKYNWKFKYLCEENKWYMFTIFG